MNIDRLLTFKGLYTGLIFSFSFFLFHFVLLHRFVLFLCLHHLFTIHTDCFCFCFFLSFFSVRTAKVFSANANEFHTLNCFDLTLIMNWLTLKKKTSRQRWKNYHSFTCQETVVCFFGFASIVKWIYTLFENGLCVTEVKRENLLDFFVHFCSVKGKKTFRIESITIFWRRYFFPPFGSYTV